MIRSVSAKYALRSLGRHTRRTILSVVGIGIGVSMALIATSWIGGAARMEIRAIVESGTGHLRIVPSPWLVKRENTLRLEDWEEARRAAQALPGAEVVALRAHLFGAVLNRIRATKGGYFRQSFEAYYDYAGGQGTTVSRSATVRASARPQSPTPSLDEPADEDMSAGPGPDGT